jgi:hypothetical protein
MSAHNALASQVIVNQLTSLQLHTMLDTTTMMDPTLKPGVERQGLDPDHRQSPCGDLASTISTSGLEHDQGWGEEDL